MEEILTLWLFAGCLHWSRDVCFERERVHVTQEDFEMAVAKVMKKETDKNMLEVDQLFLAAT